MSVIINGDTGITTPAETVQGALTTTGNTILGDATTDTLNVGAGGLVKDASGNVGIGQTPTSYGSTVRTLEAYIASATTLISANTASVKTEILSTETNLLGQVGTRTNHPLVLKTNDTERMRLDTNGSVLVGKTALNDSVAGAQIAGSGSTYPGRICATVANSTNVTEGIVVYSSSAAAYRFYVSMDGKVNATNTTIAAISDQRLKENIRDLDDGLSAVLALKPRKFDWKAGKGADTKDVRGFIAQEFEQVFPDLIDNWKDPAPEGEEPYKAVRADLIPTLVKAIQEQQALITQLQADVATLKALSA
jgi:hypothetical protein